MKYFPAVLVAALTVTVTAEAEVSLTPLPTFGGGDGWLAPGDSPYLTTDTTSRGIAFGNDHLYLVSRSGGINVRILDRNTGVDLGGLNVTGISGGTFAVNMAGVGGDGAIYVGNLTTSAASPFKVYRWADEGSAPTVAYDANPGMPRIGDSFAATGSGSGTVIVASGTGSAGFAAVDPTAGTGVAVSVPGTAAGDYRLSLTLVNDDTLVGTQGGSWKLTEFTGATGTLILSDATPTANERLLAYNVVGGVPLLATANTVSSLVRIYDVSNPAAPELVASANNTTGVLAANGTGVGSLAWGNVEGTSATLYAMSANQGIQAFTVTIVPEPATWALLALGVTGLGFSRYRRAVKAGGIHSRRCQTNHRPKVGEA